MACYSFASMWLVWMVTFGKPNTKGLMEFKNCDLPLQINYFNCFLFKWQGCNDRPCKSLWKCRAKS